MSWRISRKPFCGAFDHNPGLLDFVIVPFILWPRPVLEVPEEVIFVLFRFHPRIQILHPLSFPLLALFSDVDGKRRSVTISPTVLVVPLALWFLA